MEDLENIAPELSKINKENQFKVPEGYFNDFPARLSEQIHKESDDDLYKRKIITLKPYLAIAAMFIGVLIIGKITYDVLNKGNVSPRLTNAEITELINEDIYYFSEDIIVDMLYQNENLTEDDNVSTDIDNSTNEIIDYLIDENIDIYEIIDAL